MAASTVRTPADRKMYFMSDRKSWCARIDGKHVRLGPEQESARRRYDELMAARDADPVLKLPPRTEAAPARKVTVRLEPQLVHHRDVAAAFGVSVPTLLRWVRTGEFVAEHSSLGTFYFFDRQTIEYRLKRGLWPDGTRFNRPGKRG